MRRFDTRLIYVGIKGQKPKYEVPELPFKVNDAVAEARLIITVGQYRGNFF